MKLLAILASIMVIFVFGCSTEDVAAGSTQGIATGSTEGIATESPSKEVRQAAEQGLEEFAPMLGTLHEGSVAIPTEYLSLGYAFQVYTIDPKNLFDQANPDLKSITQSTDTWRFIVTAQSQPVALLTVEKTNGLWQAVAIGATDLAQEMNSILKDLQQDASSLRFVRVYQATSDLIEVTHKSTLETRYAALTSARVAFGIDDDTQPAFTRGAILNSMFSSADAAQALKNTVQKALAEDQQDVSLLKEEPK